ncbi:hypothetical protein [Acinetobacter towneri]|uniref:hypothetical protein n=1 Tax=Acinetobacter towneri TaxID=202956 RepID=UPI0034D631FC
MGLLDHLKTKENDFISISEAIHFLKNETNSSYAETIYFLELHGIHECATYNKNEFEYIKTDCDFYYENDEVKYHYFVYSLTNIREFITANIDNEEKIKNHIDLFKNIYWKKEHFYQSNTYLSSGLPVPENFKKKDLILFKENSDLKSLISSAIKTEKNKYVHAFFSLKFLAKLAQIELGELIGFLIKQDFYKGMKIYISSELDFHTHIELAEHENHIADLYGNKAKNGTDALLHSLIENFYINTPHYEVETKYFVRYWTVEDFLNNPIIQSFKLTLSDIEEIQNFTAEKIKNWQNDWTKSIDKISNLEKEIASLKNELNKKDNLINVLKVNINDNIGVDHAGFDSNHANYPPDLHTALLLWETYNKKESKQSWSAFANQWLRQNYSDYPEKAKDRIREIATPHVHWGNQRTYFKK